MAEESLPKTPALTDKQMSMARHALGLDGRRRVSYRNRYVTGGPTSTGHAEWMALVEAGLAGRREDMFWLKPAGAEAVLRKGESLDPEDFPPRWWCCSADYPNHDARCPNAAPVQEVDRGR